MKDMYSLGVTKFNQERLESLAAPVSKEALKAVTELKQKKDAEKDGAVVFDKQVQLVKKLEKSQKIDLKDYVDRDVPPIRGDTGEFSTTVKTSKGLKNFDTKPLNKQGLFENLIKENPGDTLAVQNMKEKMAKDAVVDGRYGHRNLRDTDKHLPNYLKAARHVQLEKAFPDQQSRQKAFRKAMNDNVVQSLGLKQHIPYNEPQYINIKDLRQLEYRSAQQIQALTRSYFTRKWYLNYIVRKKLGVAFSGVEFAQNPFLRQFNKPNTWLNQMHQVDESKLVTAIPSAFDLKLSTIQLKRLKNRRMEQQMINIKGKTKMPDNTDESRLIAKQLRKGLSPKQIISHLQQEFVAHGLQAYDQFKRLNLGIDHDKQGEPQKRVSEHGVEKISHVEDQEEREASKKIYGVFNMPTWIGDRVDKEGGKRGGIVDTQESAQYIARKKGGKERTEKQRNEDSSSASLLHHVRTNSEVAPEGGGPDGRGNGGSPSREAAGEADIRAVLAKVRATEDDGLLALRKYQDFSREPIIFYKRVINDRKMLKWTVKVGEAFKRNSKKGEDSKFFIPIVLLGQVLGSHLIVTYKMNLEALKISEVSSNQLNFKFETIWPFIMYLFNYWIKNQAALMIKTQTHPKKKIYQMELEKIEIKKKIPLDKFDQDQLIKQTKLTQQFASKSSLTGTIEDKSDPSEAQQYNDFMDFSSEIEFDERFDHHRYLVQNQGVGNLQVGQHRIDRSKPEGVRANTKEQRQINRAKLFEEYQRSVEEFEKAKRKVQFDSTTLEYVTVEPEEAERELKIQQEIKKQIEQEKYSIHIQEFINENYLYLPQQKTNSTYRLLKALQEPNYHELQKRDGMRKKNLAALNEERRRRLGLPPLKPIDYNCIDRAAQKLKLIVDCLMLSRRMSGYALVAKDVVIVKLFRQQELRRLLHQKNAKKLNPISHRLYQEWGVSVQMPLEFNPEAVQIVESMKQINLSLKQPMRKVFEDGPADNITNQIQREIEVEENGHGTGDGGEEVIVDFEAVTGRLAVKRDPLEYDSEGAKQRRIINEFENYMEDKGILDQQIVRLPEEETGTSALLFIQTIYARKIKSNIENILQILWERETQAAKASELANLIFTGDKKEGQIFDSGDESPHGLNGKSSEVAIINQQKRQLILEKAPKIVRLQSKVCKILSDHEDVQDYDLQNYPPGTSKISKFFVLDVEQEKLSKQHTMYKSYAEIQLCSPISRRQMWDDSVNVPWETFIQFFQIFGIKWSPVSFLKRGGFRSEESFLINQFFTRCLYLDQNNCKELALDLARLNFRQVKYDEIFLKLPIHQEKLSAHGDESSGGKVVSNLSQNTRKLFQKYIVNEQFLTRFDDSEYDKLIYPFYDESEATIDRLFNYRREEYRHYIRKFKDIEEQKECDKLNLNLKLGSMGTTAPIYMVEEQLLKHIRADPTHMLNLTLKTFNNGQDDLLYMGRLQLPTVIKYSKIEPFQNKLKQNYNTKIEYFVRGTVPSVLIKCFDTYTQDVIQHQTTNKSHIRMIIRICHQHSDKMIVNQLESLIQIGTSRLTMAHSLSLSFSKKHLRHKNFDQNFVNMLVCNEVLLRRFVSNNEAAKNQLFNGGVKHFKGILRNLNEQLGQKKYLVNINEYDMHVETLLYYDPLNMVHGNSHLPKIAVRNEAIDSLIRARLPLKSFDRVKIWKINLLEMGKGQSDDALLSLHDITHFYESELPLVLDLNNEVKLPNLLDLLHDFVQMLYPHRSLVGKIMLWKLPQYKRPVEKTGRMGKQNPDEFYKMTVLSIYKQMLQHIQDQIAIEDQNALPLSLDAGKKNPDRNRQKMPNLSLRCKTIRERVMPIFENNSKEVLKVVSNDSQIIIQRPKVFQSLKKFQFVLVTVIQHPSMECWIWQLYFIKTERTFSVTMYSSDLFALDDEILNDEYIVNSENVNLALWAHLINICKLVKNSIGDIMLQIQSFKEPLKEILYQDVVYNQNSKDMMFMEVVLKSYSNYVTDVESSFPAIKLTTEDVRRYSFAVRAFSLTRNLWTKDFQPFFEVVAMLKREKYYVSNMEFFYYSMLRDTACLLSHKIIFSSEAETREVRKRRLVYDIKSIIGQGKRGQRNQEEGFKGQEEQSPQLKDIKDMEPLQKNYEDPKMEKSKQIAQASRQILRPEWRNVEQLNKIIFQSVISQSPVQVCTIIHNTTKDVFIYRLYRAGDSSTFERQITSADVTTTCAPHLMSMLTQGLAHEVGRRIAQHYMANVLVASVIEFYKIQ